MHPLWGLTLLLGTVAVNEALAWAIHKYLLHGPLWFVHRSHHRPHGHFFETNDLIALAYAALSAGLVVAGSPSADWRLWVGLGIAAYGLLYFVFHDVLVHQRIRWRRRPRHAYLERIVRAHKIHHKTLGREGSEAFGFIYAAGKYAVRGSKAQAAHRAGAAPASTTAVPAPGKPATGNAGPQPALSPSL